MFAAIGSAIGTVVKTVVYGGTVVVAIVAWLGIQKAEEDEREVYQATPNKWIVRDEKGRVIEVYHKNKDNYKTIQRLKQEWEAAHKA